MEARLGKKLLLLTASNKHYVKMILQYFTAAKTKNEYLSTGEESRQPRLKIQNVLREPTKQQH